MAPDHLLSPFLFWHLSSFLLQFGATAYMSYMNGQVQANISSDSKKGKKKKRENPLSFSTLISTQLMLYDVVNLSLPQKSWLTWKCTYRTCVYIAVGKKDCPLAL